MNPAHVKMATHGFVYVQTAMQNCVFTRMSRDSFLAVGVWPFNGDLILHNCKTPISKSFCPASMDNFQALTNTFEDAGELTDAVLVGNFPSLAGVNTPKDKLFFADSVRCWLLIHPYQIAKQVDYKKTRDESLERATKRVDSRKRKLGEIAELPLTSNKRLKLVLYGTKI